MRLLYEAYILMFTKASTYRRLSTNKQIWNTSIVQVNQPKKSNTYALLGLKKACNKIPPSATPCSGFSITVPIKARYHETGAQVTGWSSSQTTYQYFANAKAAFFEHQEGREDTSMNKKIIKRFKTSKNSRNSTVHLQIKLTLSTAELI